MYYYLIFINWPLKCGSVIAAKHSLSSPPSVWFLLWRSEGEPIHIWTEARRFTSFFSVARAKLLLSSCSVSVHSELAMHFSSHLISAIHFLILPLLFLSVFVIHYLFLLPSSFNSHFLTPTQIPPSCVLSPSSWLFWRAHRCVMKRQWLLICGVDRHLIVSRVEAKVSVMMSVYPVVLFSTPSLVSLLS